MVGGSAAIGRYSRDTPFIIMSELAIVLLLACLPALGNLTGGVVAELFKVSRGALSIALHLAAGILIAVVGLELMGGALEHSPQWLILLAFIGGGLFYLLIDNNIDTLSRRMGLSEKQHTGSVAIYIAVSIDLFTDGIMIGAGTSISYSLGLLLAIGQVSADLPEGFACNASFQSAGVERSKRLVLMVSFFIPVLLGALIGYGLVRNADVFYQYLLLAFTAGILLTTAIEDMHGEAHEVDVPHYSPIALVLGFSLFALVSIYF